MKKEDKEDGVKNDVLSQFDTFSVSFVSFKQRSTTEKNRTAHCQQVVTLPAVTYTLHEIWLIFVAF